MDPDFIRDLFTLFGPVTVKRIFGGAGLWSDGLMFGLVFDGAIFLKVDETSIPADPNLGFIHLSNVIAFQGALPIKVGDETIGAAGASGAPGGEKDEACVKAGIDKVADQLK